MNSTGEDWPASYGHSQVELVFPLGRGILFKLFMLIRPMVKATLSSFRQGSSEAPALVRGSRHPLSHRSDAPCKFFCKRHVML
jgi:hypothetical protein